MIVKKKHTGAPNRRKTRIEPPVLEEAIVAAQGLSDDIDAQAEIAAQLMGLPVQEVKPAILKAVASERETTGVPSRSQGSRVVVVERRRPRLSTR